MECLAKIVNYIHKISHLRCLARFLIRFCSLHKVFDAITGKEIECYSNWAQSQLKVSSKRKHSLVKRYNCHQVRQLKIDRSEIADKLKFFRVFSYVERECENYFRFYFISFPNLFMLQLLGPINFSNRLLLRKIPKFQPIFCCESFVEKIVSTKFPYQEFG